MDRSNNRCFFVKGLCGFANTLVFTSILGFGANNVNISPVELVLGYPSNVIMTYKNRKCLKPSVCIPLAILVLVGSIPGAFLLKYLNARYLKIFFGVVIIFVGLEMFFRERSKKEIRQSKLLLGSIGLLSGLLTGLFGVGALLAAYVGRVAQNTKEFKANMSAVFIVDNTFRVILYSVLGVITWSTLKQSLLMMPFVLLGLYAGMFSSRFLDDRVVKKLVIILLIISGVMLIVKNL